jgi:hypothetical protein
LNSYLSQFDWDGLEVVKLVGTGLQDGDFNRLLNALVHTHVHSLLLPGNELQEISLDALANYMALNKHLKVVSLQRNNIHPLSGNVRAKMTFLKSKGLSLYL